MRAARSCSSFSSWVTTQFIFFFSFDGRRAGKADPYLFFGDDWLALLLLLIPNVHVFVDVPAPNPWEPVWMTGVDCVGPHADLTAGGCSSRCRRQRSKGSLTCSTAGSGRRCEGRRGLAASTHESFLRHRDCAAAAAPERYECPRRVYIFEYQT